MRRMYFGSAGSGLLIRCQNQILLTRRSSEVKEPGQWGLPGGAIPSGNSNLEEALTSAVRETEEELGSIPAFGVLGHVVYRDGDFSYSTFLVEISPLDKENWELVLNWENTKAKWFPVDGLPSRLHFGVKYLKREKPEFFRKIK